MRLGAGGGWGNLFAALQATLAMAIEPGADPQAMPADVLLPHREEGARCPRCDGAVRRVSACGRSGYFFPGCQPRP